MLSVSDAAVYTLVNVRDARLSLAVIACCRADDHKLCIAGCRPDPATQVRLSSRDGDYIAGAQAQGC